MDDGREKHGIGGRELFSSGTWASAVVGPRDMRRNVVLSGRYQNRSSFVTRRAGNPKINYGMSSLWNYLLAVD